MAVAFGSISFTTYTARTNTTVTAPTGIADGDVLICHFENAYNAAFSPSTITPPAGWTQVGSFSNINDGGLGLSSSIWIKVAASESGNYTWTHIAGNTQATIARYTGANGNVNASSANPQNSPGTTTRTATGVTTTVNDCMIINAAVDWGDNGNNLTPPTGMTERQDTVLCYWSDVIFSTAGATGNYTMVCNSNGGSPRNAWLIALEPASSGTQTITAALFTAAQSFPAATISTGAVTITGALFTNTQTFYAASIKYTILGALYTNVSTFPSATITTGSVGITGALFTNTQTFYTAVVSSGSSVILAARLDNVSTFPAATISTGVVTILGALYSNPNSFFAATITQPGGGGGDASAGGAMMLRRRRR